MTSPDDEILRRAETKIGTVLRGKWRLDRLLGLGGMASVYAAVHRNGAQAAVKVLHPEAALAPSVKSRFLREGYLANKVDHPGAVAILDDDIDEDGTVFLVMELLSGETLEMRLAHNNGKTLPPEDVLVLVDKVLDCLSAAHDKGIVHRDLKPGNLFITDTGTVKLLDFGIARLTADQQRPGQTTGAQALGTPGFMPPEQARGHWDKVDAQSDLWAVGAVMYAALIGRFVHEASTVNEQLLLAMTEPAAPVREAAPDVPQVVAEITDRALSYDKAGRWPDARTMRAAVREAYVALTGASLGETGHLSGRVSAPHSADAGVLTLDLNEAGNDPGAMISVGTTARPVYRQASTSKPSKPSTAKWTAGLAVVCGVIGLALVFGHHAESPKTSAIGAPAGVAVPAPVLQRPAAAPEKAPVQVTASPATTAVSSGVPGAQTGAVTTPKPTPAKRPRATRKVRHDNVPAPTASQTPTVEPASRPAPSEVDLFTRRR